MKGRRSPPEPRPASAPEDAPHRRGVIIPGRGADGRLEPPGAQHSWDCDYWLSNAILIQLPRHADHHAHPGRPFSALQRSAQAPLLPLGYPLLVITTLVPAWWRRLIHPRLPERLPEGDKMTS